MADRSRHALIRPRCIPVRLQRELRDLTRTHTTLVDERSAVINRQYQVLQAGSVKLDGMVADILGVGSRTILASLEALVPTDNFYRHLDAKMIWASCATG